MLKSIYCTNKYCTFLYYNRNTSDLYYNHILFSGIKLSMEFCLHHIEHELVLLTAEEIYFVWLLMKLINYYICKGIVSIFMYQLCVFIWLNDNFIKTILIPPLWKTFPMSTNNISIEKNIVFDVSTGKVA